MVKNFQFNPKVSGAIKQLRKSNKQNRKLLLKCYRRGRDALKLTAKQIIKKRKEWQIFKKIIQALVITKQTPLVLSVGYLF